MTDTATVVPSIDIATETSMSGVDLAVVAGMLLLALGFLFRRRLMLRGRAGMGPACSGCAGCGGSCSSQPPAASHARTTGRR